VLYFKRITKDHSHFSPALLWHVWKSAKTFDIIHIHAWWNTVSVLSALIALLRGVPVVISPRGTLSDYSFHNRNSFYKTVIHNLMGKPLLKRSFVHATSQHEQLALNKIIKPKHIFNIPNLITLPDHTPFRQNIFYEKLKLLFLSRIEEKKGLDILLQALPAVTVPYHLTIAGSGEAGYINSLKKIAVQNNQEQNVSWIGFQTKNKFDVLCEHDLLVLPSYDENFGNVVIESLSVGTAVLISEHVGLANYVKENDLGWVCQTNENSVASIINTMPTQQAKIAHIKSQAPDIVFTDFNALKLIQQYTDMYHKITKNG
jgi:glycosyltransferase involved in cell wall biosynthesis